MNSPDIITSPKERPRVPRPEVKKKRPEVPGDTPDLARADLERNLKVIETAESIHELDQKFFTTVWRGPEDVSERIERLAVFEALSVGDQIGKSEYLTDAGVNLTSKRVYEGDPPVRAFVKPQSGEAAYRVDLGTGTLYKVKNVFDPQTGRMHTEKELVLSGAAAEEYFKMIQDPNRPDHERHELMQTYGEWAGFTQWSKDMPKHRASVAEMYGISPEETPFSEDQYMRRGIEAGSLAMREYGVSRIDALFGLDVVPTTVVRLEPGGGEMASVQQAVESSDKGRPVRTLSVEDVEEIAELGPAHPSARSIMRIAALDYIVKSLDRWHANVVVDPGTGECRGIDNALSLGMRKVDDSGPDGTSNVVEVEPLRSVPMEIVQRYEAKRLAARSQGTELPEWRLDAQAIASMSRTFEASRSYLSSREGGKTLEDELAKAGPEGKEVKYLSSLLRQIYRNERIAAAEAGQMLAKVGMLLRDGRPPVETLISKGELMPIADEIKRQAEIYAAMEEAAASADATGQARTAT